MTTHSNILAWRIPCREGPGGLQSMGSQRVWHDWSNLCTDALKNLGKAIDKLYIYIYIYTCGSFSVDQAPWKLLKHFKEVSKVETIFILILRYYLSFSLSFFSHKCIDSLIRFQILHCNWSLGSWHLLSLGIVSKQNIHNYWERY